MRTVCWILVAGAAWCAAVSGQPLPRLAHGTDLGTHVVLTLRVDPGHHAAVFVAFSRGQTRLPLPSILGGSLGLALGRPWLLGTTLDGSLRHLGGGVWTRRLEVPPLLRRIAPRLFLQAVSFAPKRSGGLEPLVSAVLELDLTRPREPASQWQAAVRAMRAFLRPPDPQAGRHPSTQQGWYRLDPFGNRIFRPRGW